MYTEYIQSKPIGKEKHEQTKHINWISQYQQSSEEDQVKSLIHFEFNIRKNVSLS